jgi:hypothetical protein
VEDYPTIYGSEKLSEVGYEVYLTSWKKNASDARNTEEDLR